MKDGDPFSWDAGDVDMALDLDPSGGPAKRPTPAARFRPKMKGKAKAEPADDPRQPPPPAPAPSPVKKQEAEAKTEADPTSLAPSASSVPSAAESEAVAMESEPIRVAGEEEAEAVASDGMEDVEEDVVIREIDVFCSPAPIDEDTNLYVMQYVLRPSWRPYELNEKCEEVRLKPKESKLEIDLSMDVDSENYNKEVDAALRLEKQTLCSSTTPLLTSYAVGILKGNQLHLNPVHAIVQFRPSMTHLNTRQKKMQNAQSVESGKTSNDNAGGSGKPATVGSNEKVDDEPWITLEYHAVDSHLTERYHNRMVSENNYQIPFMMKPSNYVDSLCPATSTENKRTKIPTQRFWLSLPLEERLKKWLSEISQVNHFKALMHLAPDISEEDLLKTLPLYADLVQGLWVCKSSLLYEGDAAAIRDYILYEFSLKPTSRLEKLKRISFDVKTMLSPLAVKRPILSDWKFKEPTDVIFMKEHPDVVKQQEHSWSNRSKNFQTLRSVHATKSSATHGVKDRPATKAVLSISYETREYLPKALLKIFQEKRTQSMNSIINGLRALAISNSSRPRDDPKTKALINAATNGASAPVSELESIVSQIAVNIHGVYVLKSSGNAALDPLRKVVIDLFRGKEPNAKINKREICIAVQSSLKKDISDPEYKQIVQELCVSSRGSWMLKSGD